MKRPQTQTPARQQKKPSQPVKSAPPQGNVKQKTKPTGPNPLKRGQKGKIKRIRQKYADQDDEERQIRLQALQGSNAKLSAVHDLGKSQKAAAMKEDVEEPQPMVDDANEAEAESEEEEEEREEKKPLQRLGDAKEAAEMMEDGEQEDAFGEMSTLDTLTGQPMEEDTLLFALPFCAPYSALQKFKYKAKLLPGTQKRGKSK